MDDTSMSTDLMLASKKSTHKDASDAFIMVVRLYYGQRSPFFRR